MTRVPEPPVAPIITGGGAERWRGGTFHGIGNAREERSIRILICCSRERGLLPIFKSNRIRSNWLRHRELFTLHHVIESLIRVKAFAVLEASEAPRATCLAVLVNRTLAV